VRSLSLRDPGLERLRAAAVTMGAALLSFGSAWLLESVFDLTTSSVVLAVVLAMTLGRVDRRGYESRVAHLIAPLLLPFLAVVAAEVGRRMFTHPNFGDTLFVLGMTAAIWLRRFGPGLRRAGTLLSAALLAVLVTPGPAVPLGAHSPSRWWAAVIALMSLGWTRLANAVAVRTGFLPSPASEPAARVAPSRVTAGARRWPLPASTRMALQMGAALGAAFACGREAFGPHWPWVVLSAFIVGSGNRGRGDVAYKAALRVLGAAAGTVLASALSGAFAPRDQWAVVVLFAVLAVALWLRPLSYAFWAIGMTAALALLYDYYGESGGNLLATRLEGILLGAAIGVVAAWVVLPVRNVDVIRRQLSIALSTLADVVRAEPGSTFSAVEAAAFRAAAESASTAALSLRVVRHLPSPFRGALPYAVACRALHGSAPPTVNGSPVTLSMSPETRRAVSDDVTAARRALAATATPEQRRSLGETAERIAAALLASYT
jgi:hypothetical protein